MSTLSTSAVAEPPGQVRQVTSLDTKRGIGLRIMRRTGSMASTNASRAQGDVDANAGSTRHPGLQKTLSLTARGQSLRRSLSRLQRVDSISSALGAPTGVMTDATFLHADVEEDRLDHRMRLNLSAKALVSSISDAINEQGEWVAERVAKAQEDEEYGGKKSGPRRVWRRGQHRIRP